MAQQPELTPNMRVLLQRGEEKGYLSQEEILRLLSNMELGDGRVALFYDLVLERGIRVVDTLDTEEEKIETGAEGIAEIKVEPEIVQVGVDEEIKVAEEELPKVKDIAALDVTSDPVRMYLREIGQVDLLMPDEEMRLAVQMSAPQYLVKVLIHWLAQHAGLTLTQLAERLSARLSDARGKRTRLSKDSVLSPNTCSTYSTWFKESGASPVVW